MAQPTAGGRSPHSGPSGACSDGREWGTLAGVKRSAGSGSAWRSDLLTLLRGMGLGIVELVPGVSARHPGPDPGHLRAAGGGDRGTGGGGAGAAAAGASRGEAGGGGRRARVAAACRGVPWRFALVLGAGMVGAPLLFSHPVGALLDAAPGLALAFFCGVVPVAVVLPLRAVAAGACRRWRRCCWPVAGAVLLLGLPVRAATEPAALVPGAQRRRSGRR